LKSQLWVISSFLLEQVRAEIQKAKTELTIELQRSPTEEEIIERAKISPERYHDVMKASKSILSLNSRHITTQEEFINGIVDDGGVNGDNSKQPALLRLALDDVVTTQSLETLFDPKYLILLKFAMIIVDLFNEICEIDN